MSKEVIKGLEPELLWNSFYELSQVPRPSKKEEKVIKFVEDFAIKNGFNYKKDEVGNIVIEVPASEGKENAPIVVLQGHVDMVCEKNKGTEHDFENDPIQLVREGDWIRANGTTLGADNGIGVATAMAVALDKSFVHGPLELLMTVDEETGMTGVNNLKPDFLKGKILLNLDSEEDGTFYIGCSGGQDSTGIFEIEYSKKIDEEFKAYDLIITGLKGGHSGLDIHLGRANAIKLLARLLDRLKELKFKLASIKGGSKRNAIAREAEAVILIEKEHETKVKEIIKEYYNEIVKEFHSSESGIVINFEKRKEKVERVFKKKFTNRIINTLLALPHGIINLSNEIKGLVETSSNLATVEIIGDELKIGTSQRSSIDSAKKYIASSVRSVFLLAGAKIEGSDGYPGWTPNIKSPLLQVSKKVYVEMFKSEPEVKAIHAGLECGLLSAKYPGMDLISFGPTIQGAHSPDEKVYIPAVDKFYSLVKGILIELSK
jgi:dipeptidase D